MANLKDLIVNGTARIIGKTYSSEFVGNLTGNVTGNVTGDVTGSSGSCAGNAASSSSLLGESRLNSSKNVDDFIEASKLKYTIFQNYGDIGFTGNDGMIVSIPWDTANYGAQLAFGETNKGTIKVRGMNDGTWGDWKKVWIEGDTLTDKDGNPYVTSNTFAETIGNINSALDTINGEVV